MELNANNRVAVADFLDFAKRQDWNWAAFDPDETDLQGAVIFHGFWSAAEAVAFCTTIHDINAYIQGEDPGRLYQCLPVENLGLAIQPEPGLVLNEEQLENIFLHMTGHQVKVADHVDRRHTEDMIVASMFFPVTWQKTIDPASEVDRFVVIEHHHAGHQLYEIGHSVRVLDSFFSLADAEALFQERLKWDAAMGYQNDYLIVAGYRGQVLDYGPEGWPEEYSGLTLKTAHKNYDTDMKQNEWHITEVNSLNEPKLIPYYLYGRYDHSAGTVRLYDDLMKETKPYELRQSTYPSHFIHQKLTIKSTVVMNEKNYDYLKNQVKFMGFGEALEKELGEMIKLQPTNFSLEHQTKFGQDHVTTMLNFQKSKESEMYFFNSFDMTVKPANSEDTIRQTYYVGKENNLTLKERYNMLEGRAVFKEFNKLEQVGEGEFAKFKATDETYKAWTLLNFKQTDENGNFLQRKLFGFDLEKTLAKYPVKELEDHYEKSRLITSLEKGNRQNATIMVDGAEQKIAMEANPIDKGIKFYDSNMQRMEVKQNEAQKQGQSQAQTGTAAVQKDDQKEKLKQGVAEQNQQQGQRKRKHQKIS